MLTTERVLSQTTRTGTSVVGVLFRHRSGNSLRTLMAFEDGNAGLYEVESRVEFDSADPFSWTHYVHRDNGAYRDRERHADDPDTSIPGHAVHALVEAVAAAGPGDSHEYTCHVVDEVDDTIAPAVVRREGNQVVVRVGDLVTLHDIVDGVVARSVWGDDFVSEVVADADTALAGAPHQVQQRATRFLADLELVS